MPNNKEGLIPVWLKPEDLHEISEIMEAGINEMYGEARKDAISVQTSFNEAIEIALLHEAVKETTESGESQ